MIWQYFRKQGLPVLGRNNTEGNTTRRRGGMKSTALFSLMLALMLIFSTVTCAALEPIYLGFTSDVHGSTGNLTTWLEKLGAPSLNHMIFGGDYEGASGAQQCKNIVEQKYPGTDCVLVRGNHDPADQIFVQGLVYNDSDYAVYVMDSANGSFNTNEITALSNHLENTIPSSKPVFVAAHHPIHSNSGRVTGNAAALLTELNKHENVIFLWGHNHTVNDPYYGKVMTKGTTINGHSQPINFTYLSYGAMRDGTNGAYGLLGTIAEAVNGTEIDFDYKNLSGNTIANGSGSVFITGETGGTGYELVTSPQNNETYVVVAKSGSQYYALTTEAVSVASINTLKGIPVTVSGNYVTSSVSDDMLWKFTTSGKGFNVKNGSNFLNRRAQANAGIYLNTKSDGAGYADWIYDSGDKSLRTESTQVSDKFYILLKNSGTTYYFANDKANKSEIYLYKLAEVTPPTQYRLTLTGTGLTSTPSAGLIDEGTEVTVTAAPASGMRVATFTVNGVDKKSELINNQYTFNITTDTNVAVAYESVPVTQYTLTVSAVPVAGGTVTGSGSYQGGTNVNVTATAAGGYEFVNWTVDGETVGTNASFIYTMPAKNVALVANFRSVTTTEPTLRIDPVQSSISVGAETIVRVKLDNAENINGVGIELSYDPAVLSVEKIEEGSIKDVVIKDFESQAGKIDFDASNSAASDLHDAVVLEVTFRGLTAGSSDIKFERHQLSRMMGGNPVYVENDAIPGNVTVISGGTIHGFVKLSRRSGDHSGATVTAKVGETQYTTTTGVNGEFTLTGIPAGNVNLVISIEKYLVEKINLTVIAGETHDVGTIIMRVGNILGENEIGLSDLVKFAGAYRTELGDGDYDPLCDLNEDGTIDLLDLTLFASNYRQTGD